MGDGTAGLLDLVHGLVDNVATDFIGESDDDRLLLVYSKGARGTGKSCGGDGEEAHVGQ